jgi:hypothetical protein
MADESTDSMSPKPTLDQEGPAEAEVKVEQDDVQMEDAAVQDVAADLKLAEELFNTDSEDEDVSGETNQLTSASTDEAARPPSPA